MVYYMTGAQHLKTSEWSSQSILSYRCLSVAMTTGQHMSARTRLRRTHVGEVCCEYREMAHAAVACALWWHRQPPLKNGTMPEDLGPNCPAFMWMYLYIFDESESWGFSNALGCVCLYETRSIWEPVSLTSWQPTSCMPVRTAWTRTVHMLIVVATN